MKLRERAPSMESGTPETAEDIEIFELQSALDEAKTDWFLRRALKRRIPTPHINNWVETEETEPPKRLKPSFLLEFEDAIIKAERETWRHRREWMAFIFAVLFGVVTAVSVFYNILSTQRKLNDIQAKQNDTQSVLADTQAKLYDTQKKLSDLTEQVRRLELTTGKRGKIPRRR